MDQKSIAYGSAVSFVNSINNSSPNEDVGIVIANMGQLLWYRRGRKALSFVSWHAIPRPTAVTPALTVTNKNLIPKNTKPSEHVACVFEEVLAPLVDRGCKLDVIAVGNGAIDLVDYFQQDWGRWEKGMEAIAILSGYVWAIEFFDSRFMEFWRKVRLFLNSSESKKKYDEETDEPIASSWICCLDGATWYATVRQKALWL